MSWKVIAGALVAVAAVLVAIVLIAGGDDTADAKQTDDDFMAQMTAHHEMAIEMAELAQERAEHAEVRQLAGEIIAAQTAEIDRMGSIHERMFDEGIEGHEHGMLGMSHAEMGMNMNMTDLENAKPFDKEFIDSMVAHHQGAIRMARIEKDKGEDDELAEICDAIIVAQTAEIEEMNMWHEQWYGAPSSSGGAPEEGESSVPPHEMMGH